MLSYKDEDRGDTFCSDQPLVAVVIPAFNASTYIERTLRSAMRQTYAALEISLSTTVPRTTPQNSLSR